MSDVMQGIESAIRRQQSSYFGKFRAFVVDTNDPEGLGRVKLTIPSVLGEATSDWAMPCVPYGGGADYGVLWVPPVGSQVLAEFIEGDPSAPVWAGTFWRRGADVPSEYRAPTTKVLKTESGHVLSFEDADGSEAVTVRSAANAEVVLNPDGGVSLTDRAGATVTLDAAGGEIVVSDANGNSVVMSSSGITCSDASGNKVEMTPGGIGVESSAVVSIEGSQIAVGGVGGEPLLKGMTFLSMFNSHTHATSGGPSGPPMPPLTPAALTSKSTAQ